MAYYTESEAMKGIHEEGHELVDIKKEGDKGVIELEKEMKNETKNRFVKTIMGCQSHSIGTYSAGFGNVEYRDGMGSLE